MLRGPIWKVHPLQKQQTPIDTSTRRRHPANAPGRRQTKNPVNMRLLVPDSVVLDFSGRPRIGKWRKRRDSLSSNHLSRLESARYCDSPAKTLGFRGSHYVLNHKALQRSVLVKKGRQWHKSVTRSRELAVMQRTLLRRTVALASRRWERISTEIEGRRATITEDAVWPSARDCGLVGLTSRSFTRIGDLGSVHPSPRSKCVGPCASSTCDFFHFNASCQ